MLRMLYICLCQLEQYKEDVKSLQLRETPPIVRCIYSKHGPGRAVPGGYEAEIEGGNRSSVRRGSE